MLKIDQLKNGLKIAAEPMKQMESVAIGIWIRAGGRYENKKNSGISHLLEHLLFKGTESRDMMKIKQEIEGKGGSFNGFTSEDHTCYLVKLLSKDTELGIDILSDMVRSPRMDPKEIEKEKSVIIEEINMYKDMPSHHVHELLAQLMWPDQPLGMPLAGTVESVRSITRQDIVKYKDRHYNSKNILVAAAGNIDEASLVKFTERHMQSMGTGQASIFEKARVGQKSPRTNLYRKETEQTHITIGVHAIDRFDPDRYAISLLNVILGGNMSSRLFHIVRDELALCYEISSAVRRYEDCGAMVISAGVDDKKMVKALETIMGQITGIKKEPVSLEELGRAKEYYRGQLLFALEDTMSRMLWFGEKMLLGEKELNPRKILEYIDSVTPDDIIRVARNIFKNESLNLAVIGPIKDDRGVKEALHLR